MATAMATAWQRGLVLPGLVVALVVVMVVWATPAPAAASAWSDHDLHLDDFDLDHDPLLDEGEGEGVGDGDEDEDEDHVLAKEGIRRVRMPSMGGAHSDWDVDFEKMLNSEVPWGMGQENYEEFARRFSPEPHKDHGDHPEHEDHADHPEHHDYPEHLTLDGPDDWE